METETKGEILIDLQRRTDMLSAIYLLATAGLVLLFRSRVPQWGIFVGIHLLLSFILLCGRMLFPFRRLPFLLQLLRDWYPLLGFMLLYKEVELLAAAFGNWGLTELIQQLETRLFQGHPSIYLSEHLAWVLLSEYLHLCYFSYMVLVPVVGGYWYFTGRTAAFRELLFLVCLTYYISYLFFILFPVDSPFYLFDALGEPSAGHFFYNLVHFASERGGARGGAFPSSHVSVSVVVWLTAWFNQRRLAYLLIPIVVGVILATVYGRFHYALDSIAGLAFGGLIFVIHRIGFWPGHE